MNEILVVDSDRITLGEGSAVIVMDGECHGHCGPHMDCTGTTATSMPAQVRRLTKPCQTCGGEYDEAFQWRDWQTVERIKDCPDCHNGKPTFTLHQRCPHLMVKTWGLGDQCIRCLGEGVIDFGEGWVITDIQVDAMADRLTIHAEQVT